VPHALPLVVAIVAATCAAYASLLGHWFYSDDFTHLLHTRDLGAGGVLRFLLFADYGDRPWVYWRPGWIALIWFVQLFAGTTPWPYYLGCILLHAGASVLVFTIGLRAAGSTMPALAASLLFAFAPSHCEAVAWISASYNVVPAAMLLTGAGWASWRFATVGGARRGAAAVLLVALSLLWKEAGYAMPFVFAAACACAGGAAPARAWRGRLPVFAAMALLVAWHWLSRSNRTALAGSGDAIWMALVHHAAMFLRGVLPMLPGNDLVAVAVVAAAAIPLFLLGSATARFFLLWAFAAMLPYVVMTHGERFAYFFHVPAVLFVARFAADVARRLRWPRGPAVLGALGVLFAVLAASHLPAALDVHRQRGDECRAVWTFVDGNGLAARPELVVDAMPLSLENGFEAMLEVFSGHRPRVVPLQVVPRPPFLLYLNRDFGGMPATAPILQFRTGAELRVVDKAQLVGDAVPLPILSLAGDYELVADEAAARAALRRPGIDPVARPLLFERPPCELQPPGEHRIENLAVDLRETTFDVECSRPTLLSIAFPVTVDLDRNGRILVDGEPVPVLRANLLFHAICLPPGRHHVTLRPALVGG